MLLLKVAVRCQDAAKVHSILLALSENVLRPSCTHTLPVIADWFCSPAAASDGAGPWRLCSTREPNIESCTTELMLPLQNVHQQVVVDPCTGIIVAKQNRKCKSGTNRNSVASFPGVTVPAVQRLQLRSIDLSEEQQQKMMYDVTKIAIENSNGEQAAQRWASFVNWMEHRCNETITSGDKEVFDATSSSTLQYPFDVIIDGANVGYYKQNFAGAPKHINWEQLDWVLRHFQMRGHRPLIILHQRHTFPNNLPAKFAHLPSLWREQKIIYNTPSGANDDWYWLWAALFCQSRFNTLASQTIDPSVVPRTVLLISNDEMRDHHFRMPSKTVTVADVQAFSVSLIRRTLSM